MIFCFEYLFLSDFLQISIILGRCFVSPTMAEGFMTVDGCRGGGPGCDIKLMTWPKCDKEGVGV